MRKQASGQSTTEYLVICAALAAALFYAEFDGKNIVQVLSDGIQSFHSSLTYTLSLP